MASDFRAWALSIARFQAMAHLQQLGRRRWVSLDPDVADLIADDMGNRPDKQDAELKLVALEECLNRLSGRSCME